MNLNNKTFKDNRTGEVLKVIDSFENIAILENKTKIDTRRLMDPNHFTEQVDPASFFNTQNAYDSLFEKIKTIPADRIPDENGEISPRVSRPCVFFQHAERIRFSFRKDKDYSCRQNT
jgi:hypothetical protein